MIVKRYRTRLVNDFGCWNVEKSFPNNDVEDIDDEEQSIALSVNLLLKNHSNSSVNCIHSPAHVVTSPKCQCRRLFHLFCTDLFDHIDSDMNTINIPPAPRCCDRNSSRRISTPYRKHRPGSQEDTGQGTNGTNRSERFRVAISENHSHEKKSRTLSKVPSRTSSSFYTATSDHSFRRPVHTPIKPSSSMYISKQLTSLSPLQVQALSIPDQSYSNTQILLPRTPPPSPKSPSTQEPLLLPLYSTTPTPLQVVSLTPRIRNVTETKKPLTNISSVKIPSYEDYVREYLSTALDDSDKVVDDNINQKLPTVQPHLSVSYQSLSRPRTALSIRLLSHIANRYSSITKAIDASSDVRKPCIAKAGRTSKPRTRLLTSAKESNHSLATGTKTTSIPQTKSVFGFSKTASSMHFGYAVDRLGLQGSFEKWPRPCSQRTPIERKHEVTTLRLATLPLVTS